MKSINKKIAITAMFAALSYVSTFVFHFLNLSLPAIPFLSYDPKDIIICISGFILGPFAAIGISVIVSLLEMITISSTGFYGLIMNIVATCAFAVPASLIYQKKKNFKGAIISLIFAFVSTLFTMILWNIIITPIYLSIDRSLLIQKYLAYIVAFNAIQSGINISMVLLLYKPIVTALRAIHLVDSSSKKTDKKTTILMVAIGLILLVSLIVVWILIK